MRNRITQLMHVHADVVQTQNWNKEVKLLSEENFDVPEEPHFTKMINYQHNFCYSCLHNQPHFHFDQEEMQKAKKQSTPLNQLL